MFPEGRPQRGALAAFANFIWYAAVDLGSKRSLLRRRRVLIRNLSGKGLRLSAPLFLEAPAAFVKALAARLHLRG